MKLKLSMQMWTAIAQCKSQKIVFVMGDLNAKVGCGKQSDIVGPHGPFDRNEWRDVWVQWCKENSQVITNTYFAHYPRRLWTSESPDGHTKNQIDFTNINKRFCNAILQVKVTLKQPATVTMFQWWHLCTSG